MEFLKPRWGSRPTPVAGPKLRQRPESFGDHYSQARMFYRSMTPPEQRHIVGAVTFGLAKVETVPIRTRVPGHLERADCGVRSDVCAHVERVSGVAEPCCGALRRTPPCHAGASHASPPFDMW